MIEVERVYLDSSVLDPSFARDASDFAGRFQKLGWVWCRSDEQIVELLDAARSPEGQQFIQQCAQRLLPLLPESLMCRNGAQVVLEELRGQPVRPFEDGETLSLLQVFWEELANGNFSRSHRIWSSSDQWRSRHEQFKRKLEHARQRGARKIEWEKFLFLKIRKHLISLRSENPDEGANQVLSHPHMFPHLRTHSMAAYKLSYDAFPFRASAMFDLLHLVHAVDVDVLVTNDRMMKDMAEEIFHGHPVVWTKEVLFEALN